VALHMQEFRFAAAHYPVVFSDDAVAMPIAVLGYREGRNLFVDAQGQWAEGAYVPAYVRRYPFVIGQGAKPDEPILYLDRDSDIVVDMADEAEADALFVDGAPSERVKQALEFCGAFQQQAPLTQAFVDAINKHDLLENKEIRLDLPKGQQQLLTGLRIIDEAKFNALPDEEFLVWRRQGWVAAVYWHWASMDNFRRMVQLG
jgi:SapC protein